VAAVDHSKHPGFRHGLTGPREELDRDALLPSAPDERRHVDHLQHRARSGEMTSRRGTWASDGSPTGCGVRSAAA
jgi:hypothetical protein